MEIYSGQEYLRHISFVAKEKRLTVKAICYKANISERSYSRWIKGERSPKISDVIRLFSVIHETR